MKKSVRIIAAAAAAVLAVTCFAGCSGQKTSAKKYVIATDTTFAPFEYQDKSGEYVGIDIDILAAVAADQGFEYELKPLGFDASCAALESNQVDGVIAGMSIKEERKLKYDFSDKYYDSGVVFAVKSDAAYGSYEDIKGMTVAVKNGTEGAAYAETLKSEYNFTLQYFDESPLMYQAVLSGTDGIVACVEDYPVIGYGISQGNGLKMLGDMKSGSSYGFAVAKGKNAELLEKFNAGLKNIRENGKYQQILDKYISTK